MAVEAREDEEAEEAGVTEAGWIAAEDGRRYARGQVHVAEGGARFEPEVLEVDEVGGAAESGEEVRRVLRAPVRTSILLCVPAETMFGLGAAAS